MSKKIRILNLDDSPLDAELNLFSLEDYGLNCEIKRVETKEAFLSVIDQGEVDIILADHSLPTFGGLSALGMVQHLCPDLPFIFVTDSLDQEVVEDILKTKAIDYVSKSRLARLGPAVQRAMDIKKERQEGLQAEQALRENERNLSSIYRASPAGIGIVIDRVICQVNDRLCRMVGYSREELIGKSTRIFFPSDTDFNYVGQEKYAQIREQGMGSVETRWQHKNGQIIEVLLSSAVIEPGNLSAGVTFMAMDITQHKQAEKSRLESEERFRCLAEATMEGIAVIREGKVLTANQSACEMFGYELPEVIGRPYLDFVAQESRPLLVEKMEEGTREPFELVELRKDGSRFIAEVCGKNMVFQGQPAKVTVIRDITKNKKNQQTLLDYQKQLQSMSLHISELEEIKRKEIARILHDRVGQKLAALSLNLNIIAQLVSEDKREKTSFRINESLKLVEEISRHTRLILMELRPAVLDDFGLVSAIHWHGKQFSDRTGINVNVQGEEFPPRLSQELETIIFSIVQETLTNIAKHSQADQVDIVMEKRNGRLNLSITDNGCGFVFEGFRPGSEKGGWGLTFMHERAAALGGELQVQSEPGKGTGIRLSLPLIEAIRN